MVAVMALRRCPTCTRHYRSDERFCPQDGASLDEAPEADDPQLGRLIAGRYRLQRLLGRGGMGVVYEAEQLPLGRAVAVKLLGAERARRPEAVQRFLREARAVSRLKSPFSVTLLDFGDDGGEPFLVMELARGETLRAHLARDGALAIPIIVDILGQVGRALAEAHALGVVHRDLKPDNIAIESHADGSLNVKVLDFGIARLVDDDEPLTQTSQVPGTPQYIAPERVSGEPLGPASDIYALGIIAYELVTGAPPYRGTAWEVMHAHVSGRPKPFVEVVPDRTIPESFTALVWRALARSPELRPADGAAFVAALDALGLATPQAALTPAPIPLPTDAFGMIKRQRDRETPRSRARIVTLAVSALGFVGLGALVGALVRSDTIVIVPGAILPIVSDVPMGPSGPSGPGTPGAVSEPTVAHPIEPIDVPTAALEPAPAALAPAAEPSTTPVRTRPPTRAPPANPTLDPNDAERVDRLLP